MTETTLGDCRIYTAPVIVPGGENWLAGLGDVQARGRTELEAKEALRKRLAELERQLRGVGRPVPMMRADTDQPKLGIREWLLAGSPIGRGKA